MILLNEILLPALNNNQNVGQSGVGFIQIMGDIIIPTSALVVSVFVYLIYKEQTNIQAKMFELAGKQKNIQEKELEYLDKQLILQKINFEPKFQIKSQLRKTGGDSIFDTEFLQIDNVGFYVSDYLSTIKTFYTFSDYDININSKTEFTFPVNGYFAVGSYMGSKTNQNGTLETRFDYKNNFHFTNLYFKTIERTNNSKHVYSVSIYNLIEISYSDYERKRQVKYFCKEAINAYEVTKDVYDKRNVVSSNSYPIEYSSLNFDKVLALLNEHKNNTQE
jgi:hypothetical protein